MTAALSAPQLRAVVERALARADGADLVLVAGDPARVPAIDTLADRPAEVVGSSSPLEIRALARRPRPGVLVVVTDRAADELGEDLVARAARRRVVQPQRWPTVCELFGAQQPSRALAQRPHLADALIELRPLGGYPPAASRTLDLDTAIDALAAAALGVPGGDADLTALLDWAERRDVPGRWNALDPEVRKDLTGALRRRFGPGAEVVCRALDEGLAVDVTALGLVAEVVHHPDGTGLETPRALLDRNLSRPGLSVEAWRALAAAAVRRVNSHLDPVAVSGWIDRAEQLLVELDASAAAHLSSVVPSGFTVRLQRAAEAVHARRHNGPEGDAELARRLDDLARHRDAADRRSADRVERVRMAARLARRGDAHLRELATITDAVTHYVTDGAWVDAARRHVSRGDPDPTVDEVLDAVAGDADRDRTHDLDALAHLLRHVAGPLPEGLVGIEAVLDEVVAPLAEQRPVLLVVLDGLSWPVATDVIRGVTAAGWTPVVDLDRRAARPVLATIPTITETSRASLLAGRRTRGDRTLESRELAAHERLRAATGTGRPPVVFHKTELRDGGLDTHPDEVVDAIADTRQRLVAVVINTIDEHLADVAEPTDGWRIDDLAPLRDLLAAARRAGRALVVTSDHGHVLDRGAEHRHHPGGGERWRVADPPPGPGEIELSGPRVLTGGGTVVVPVAEQLRYAPRHNGYHGGCSLQELVVPLVVFAADDLDGWTPTDFSPPAWWDLSMAPEPAPLGVPAPAPPPPRPTAPPSATPTLFDEPVADTAPAPAPAPAAGGDWVEALLADEGFVARRSSPRVRLGDDELVRLLRALDRWAGATVSLDRLAAEAALPETRIRRYLAQVQDLVNVEGYGVVEVTDREVRFDRDLLRTQFDL